MSEPTTIAQEPQTGLTRTEVVFSYEVLESLREHFEYEGMHTEANIMNEAHYLVQEFHKNNDFNEVVIA